ncbi:MAG TPA: hypothetical protein DEP84_02835 [Chloroflexi bacterium]|nr:hypothetical protein [Chloroflexota bacterium]
MKAEYYRAAADEGFFIESDCFGHEHYYALHPGSYRTLWAEPQDTERAAALLEMIEHGCLSQDVCFKTNLRRYGGWRYDHLLPNVSFMCERMGIMDAALRTMLVENPARVLAV